jgi:hypothetical protein
LLDTIFCEESMQSSLWCYVQHEQSVGPVPEEQLRAMFASGELSWDTLVWREGMPEWLPARQIQDLVGAPSLPTPTPTEPAPFQPLLRVPIGLDERPEPRNRETSQALAGAPPIAVEWLRRTKPWVRFLAVLGLVVTILSVAGAVALSFTLDSLPGLHLRGVDRLLPLVGAAILLALQLPPLLLLNGYANRIGHLLRSNAPMDLEEALQAQKRFWTYMGILVLVLLVLYVLAILAAVGMGLVSMGRLRL